MGKLHGRTLIEDLWNDLVVTLRALKRSPQLTTAAVLTLALGIGASSAIVSVVDAVLLQPSPFEDPERLVMVWETDRASETSHEPASWPDVLDLGERSRTLSAIGSMTAVSATLTGAGEPERISALGVTPGLPELLGVRPVRGRSFDAGEGTEGGPAVALLSEDFWRRRYGADPGVLGSAIVLDGEPVTVVGVLPAEADLGIRQVHAKADYSVPLAGPEVQVWLAMVPSVESSPRQTHPFLTLGRLAPGASLEAAQGELAGIMADLERAYPENADRGVHLEPYDLVTFGPVRPALLVLLGAVAMVLLVACGNVANLMLARSAVRSRELAVRRALGAGWGRVARQFLVESAVLTGLGTAAALALAFGGLRLLVALAPDDIPRLDSAALDLRVLAFTVAVAVGTAAVFGLAPLARSRRLDLQGDLKAQAGLTGATGGREIRRFRGALVVAEVALAVALVIGAGVLLRSFWTLSGVDPGFRAANVTKLEYQLPSTRYPVDYSRWPNLPAITGFHAELLRQVQALPGVEAAAIASRHPLDPGFTNSFTVVGREAEGKDWPEIRCRFVTPGYVGTMNLPLVAGRDLTDGDVAGEPPVALINRAAAERYFAGRDPLGQQIRFWGTPWRIVGVIGDERFLGLAEEPEPAVYAPLYQAPQQSGVLLVRAVGGPLPVAQPVRRILHRLDPQIALYGVEPLEATVAESIARPRFTATLLALFGAVAILLALIGVHGVLSYMVAQRAPEVAVRMALGATRGKVLALVLRDGAALAALGTAIGLAVAFAGARLLSSLVFGVAPRDAVTFSAVALGVMVMAIVASWLPARRAAGADPCVSLRSE
jgi:putative ABC transport system permease protein